MNESPTSWAQGCALSPPRLLRSALPVAIAREQERPVEEPNKCQEQKGPEQVSTRSAPFPRSAYSPGTPSQRLENQPRGERQQHHKGRAGFLALKRCLSSSGEPCVVRGVNVGQHLAGGNSSWCPELKVWTTVPFFTCRPRWRRSAPEGHTVRGDHGHLMHRQRVATQTEVIRAKVFGGQSML